MDRDSQTSAWQGDQQAAGLPHVDSLEGLNTELIQHLRKDLSRTLRGKSASKGELLAQEQSCFLPFPRQQFEARRVETGSANSLSLVRFDRNDYTVPHDRVRRVLTVLATPTRVRIVEGDHVVAEHAAGLVGHLLALDREATLYLADNSPSQLDRRI